MLCYQVGIASLSWRAAAKDGIIGAGDWRINRHVSSHITCKRTLITLLFVDTTHSSLNILSSAVTNDDNQTIL